MRDYQKYAITLAMFAAGLYVALIVAGLGIVSLVTDRDVIVDPQAGPLLGPMMVGVSAVYVTFRMVWSGIRTRPEHQRVMLGYSLLTGIAAAVLFVAAGALIYLFGNGDLAAATSFALGLVLGPFTALTGVFAFAVTLMYSWLLAAHVGSRGRPLWPWERPDG
ncbi:hypothetical protein JF66_14255 [Cryobacterium sp. MLB-32]|uniref:DUF6121 family protein n=1 Tax=Cryobacterium sp. MLB-32 TaxID=1529318 RepID=UPI0004E71FCC|nr:DUF6121 family protein [Cryobacterium sp. MLB-32]KFF59018.1 hypothetical protein JF66_14255 [Cryobacterium sp. MLB-32]